MATAIDKLQIRLKENHQKRNALLRYLLKNNELAVGSVSVVNRKCGKSSCHCFDGEGHPQTIFLFKAKDGKRQCKLIRREDAAEVIKAGENYREFKEHLRNLDLLYKQERNILGALMEARGIKYE